MCIQLGHTVQYFNPLRFGILYAREGQTENEIYANSTHCRPLLDLHLQLLTLLFPPQIKPALPLKSSSS
jgi:hypothetical protein